MYPNNIDKFTEKLNKIDGNTYVIEEEVNLKDGVYEGELEHDNVSSTSVRVYTESKLTGEKLENFILSTPSTTPWKTVIRLYGNVDKAYITYETPGDTIEAEDINKVQESIVSTQKALNGEAKRAIKSEDDLNENLNEEMARAKNAEKVLTDNLNSEINRAKSAEEKLTSNISETNKNLNNEITRAKASEQNLLHNLNAEINRAVTSEKALADNLNITNDNLSSEITRSRNAESVINNDLSSYKTINNAEIQGLKVKDTDLENKKANKTYVDTELNKRYLKEQVFTKEEVLQKIQDIIGTAPEALDTLQEIAKALNNDADFAGTMTNELSKKVDKVVGKQLSTEDYTTVEKNKLAGVEQGANKYIHPSTHSIDIIVENANKRFVSDTEKANWNAKETPTGAQTKADNALKTAKEYTDTHDSNEVKHILSAERTNWNEAYNKRHEHNNKSVLDKITQALLDAWDTSVTHISDSVKHITSNERTLWNTVSNKVDKVTGKGLSTNDFDSSYKGKLDGIATAATKIENSSTNGNIKINGTEATVYTHPAGTNPHGTTKGDIGLSNVDNVKQATKTEFDTHASDRVKHITAAERTTWNGKANATHTHDDRYYTETEVNSKFATKEEISKAGYGDMLKSVYDKNNNGKVDTAEIADSVPWTGVTGKPSTFNPSTHTHTKSQIIDFPTTLPANGGNADTVDGKHAVDFQYKNGSNYYNFGATGTGISNKWYEVITWTVGGQYSNFQARISLTTRATRANNSELHVRAEYGASAWSTYSISVFGDFLDTRETFLLVLNNDAKTATLYYKKSYDWDITTGTFLINFISGGTFAYKNMATNSTTTPIGDITVEADMHNYWSSYNFNPSDYRPKNQAITWNNLKGV